MKILTEDLLSDYGFIDKSFKSTSNINVMTKNDFEISIRADGMYYTNIWIDYPINDTANL